MPNLSSGEPGLSKQRMMAVNATQAAFYESIQAAEKKADFKDGYVANERAGWLTRCWAALRNQRKNLFKEHGVREHVEERVRNCMLEASRGNVLEIGCFNGTRNSLWLARRCAYYIGLDLSPSALKVLQSKLADEGLETKAELRAGDLLEFTTAKRFDLVYAQGVLHHFQHPEVLFPLIHSLMKPGGVLVFSDPVEINFLLRIVRRLYRPFQSDHAWEWPFNSRTVSALDQSFALDDAFGYGRFSTLWMPFLSVPGLFLLLGKAYRKLVEWELARPFDRQKIWQNAVVYGAARARLVEPAGHVDGAEVSQ
jgi:SAM-dependent methyltransferase